MHGGLNRIELSMGENRGMAMKSERGERVKLLLVREPPIRAKRAPARSESLEKGLAIAELHPFVGTQSGGYRIGRLGHCSLAVETFSPRVLALQMV